MKFEVLGLPESILAGIRDAGFERCTPIQEETLPELILGRNVAAQSQTGTGKTATFVLGMLYRLEQKPRTEPPSGRVGRPRALVLAPTRELADQIGEETRLLAKHCNVKVAAVYGGVGYERQERDLPVCDILVATPGRLMDFMDKRAVTFDAIEAVVVDEADRMFDMGFIPDIRRIYRRFPKNRELHMQLYSATITPEVRRLAYEFMPDYLEITIAPDQVTVDQVEEEMYHLKREERMSALLGILATEAPQRTLIFCNMKRDVERVAYGLFHNGYRVAMWTGDVPQSKRLRIVEMFREGSLPIVVASDVAARGIHVEQIDLVINWDLPNEAVSYVHRIGRTARAGHTGKAITLAGGSSVYNIPEIEAYLGREINVVAATEDLFVENRAPRYRSGEISHMSLEVLVGKPHEPSPGGGKRRRSRRRRTSAEGEAAPMEAVAASLEGAPEGAPASEAVAVEGGEPPKRRRRRGGRGRRRGAQTDAPPATEAAGGEAREARPAEQPKPAPAPRERGERGGRGGRDRDRGKRSKREWTRADSVPADTVPKPRAPEPVQEGWITRLARRITGKK